MRPPSIPFSLLAVAATWFGVALRAQQPPAAPTEPPKQATAAPAAGGWIAITAGAFADDRPVLCAVRDGGGKDVVAAALADGAIPYIALIEAGRPELVWGGANEAGLGAAGVPLLGDANRENGAPPTASELASLVKAALQHCRTVAEVEALLNQRVADWKHFAASLAVIDGKGGGAVLQLRSGKCERTDVAKQQPRFLLCGDGGNGDARSSRGLELLRRRRLDETDSAIRFASQELIHDIEAPDQAPKPPRGLVDGNFGLHRAAATAALIVQGVAAEQEPSWTACWVALGQPLFTPMVPLFPAARLLPPTVGGDPRSSLAAAGARLAETFYVAGTDGGSRTWLDRDRMAPIRRQTLFFEAETLALYEEALTHWRSNSPTPMPKLLRAFQDVMAQRAAKHLAEQQRAANAPAGASGK